MTKKNKGRRFETYVFQFIREFKTIRVPAKKIKQLKEFVKKVVEVKRCEPVHVIDGLKEIQRFYNGFLGEAALEVFFGKEFIDWSIGNSRKYNKADLEPLGLDVGIKTVEYGKFPVVHKKPVRPEIIILKVKHNEVLLCGLATVVVLEEYQDDDLIIDPRLRARGVKTGFYGFSKLKPFNNLEELIELVGKEF